MAGDDLHSRLRNRGTVIGGPESGLRFMRRRRIGTTDRNGDPLTGLPNLFTIGVVLAIVLLIAALAAVGLLDLLTNKNLTIVTNPGTPDMQVYVKDGNQIAKLDLKNSSVAAGEGTLLGSFYRLPDGRIIYVPGGDTPPNGSTPTPAYTPETPYSPYASPTPITTPTPSVTLTPDAFSNGTSSTSPPRPTPYPSMQIQPESQIYN